jgi:S-(hydroxymethyl)glutathione dehydrogenase/alcohol dehydrogenase
MTTQDLEGHAGARTARAQIFHGADAPLALAELTIAAPIHGEVLVEVAASGVCHSDLHIRNGLLPSQTPMVLGHEAAGIVRAVGPGVTYVKPGDHVITCLSAFCGSCESCLSGHPALCIQPHWTRDPGKPGRLTSAGTEIAQFCGLGAYADTMLVHEHAVVRIDDDMPLDRAALIGCAVVTGLGAVFHTAGVRPGSTVAVFGCGGIGLNVVQGARIAGARRIIAIDPQPTKRELAARFGATDLVDAADGDTAETVAELTGGGVDFAFEAVGRKETCEAAFRSLRSGGVATVIGVLPIGVNIEIHGLDLLLEKKLQGSQMGSNRFRFDMPKYIDFYRDGRLRLDELVAERIGLEDLPVAFKALERGDMARSVIVFDHG